MSIIPLEFQRRYEERWAARFFRPDPSPPKKQGVETPDQQPAAPVNGKRKTHRVKPAGLRSAPAV
jgi:hypothetical protein